MLLLSFATAKAQDYQFAVGLRAGLASGITYKQMLSSNTAVEGILTIRYGGINVTGLFQMQQRLPGTQRFNWYYGGGAHVGIYQTQRFNIDRNVNDTRVILGADGILGIEYNFDFPLNVSLDWKPAINILGYGPIIYDGLGLSLRYYFIHE